MEYTGFRMLERYESVQAVTGQELKRRWDELQEMMGLEDVEVLFFPTPAEAGLNLWLCGERGQEQILFYREGEVEEIYQPESLTTDSTAHPAIIRRTEIDFAHLRRCTKGNATKVGIVFPAGLKIGTRERMQAELGEKPWKDVTLSFERVKGRKSDFEVELIRDTARMIQKVFEAFPAICRKGRLYKDICDDLQYLTASLGCSGEYMISMLHVFDHDGCSLTPLREAEPGMRAEEGHQIAYLLETNSQNGYYSVLGRVFSFGKPSEAFLDKYRVAVAANRLAGSMMRPGTSPRQIADTVNAFIRASGYPTDNCCYMHSLGCNMGEAPGLGDYSHEPEPNPTENDPLVLNTQLHCHPHVGFREKYTSRSEAVRCIDMYITGEYGGVRMDSLPQELVTL